MTIQSASQNNPIAHKRGIAFHEAGYATAIYLNSKTCYLPAVFFQITVKDLNGTSEERQTSYRVSHDKCMVSVEGGRLIESVLPSIDHAQDTPDEVGALIEDEMIAFETDIINLLIGSLAEAKYVAEIDDEPFNQKLVHLHALKNYGGNTAIALTADYLQRFSICKQTQDKKRHELLNVAFNFINDQAHWLAITLLANTIINSDNKIISAEEVAAIANNAIMSTKLLPVANDKPAAILFVDDEINILNALGRLFHREPYVTYFAASGEEGLRILQQHPVDLIISDMRMPEMNGVEFLAQAALHWPKTIRILLTGYADMQSIIDAVNKGRICNYCNKPWNDEELKLLIRQVLEQKAATRDR